MEKIHLTEDSVAQQMISDNLKSCKNVLKLSRILLQAVPMKTTIKPDFENAEMADIPQT